jgi:putative methyltransferase
VSSRPAPRPIKVTFITLEPKHNQAKVCSYRYIYIYIYSCVFCWRASLFLSLFYSPFLPPLSLHSSPSLSPLTLVQHHLRRPNEILTWATPCRYADIIERCLTEAGIADQQKDYGDWMVKVLFYELLVGKGKIQGGGAVSRFVKENAAPVKEVLEKHMAKAGVKAACELLPAAHREVIMPRYARVNTLKISVRDAVSKLEESGYKLSDYATVSTARSERRSESSIFALDGTLDDVILFPYGTDLHMHPMVTSSELRLQDKASCFPAHVMAASEQPIEVALDACSAPGNKTTHLSALMGGKGKLIAVEMDRRRSELLQNTVDIMGAANVEVQRKDFLSLPRDRKPYSEVQGIMLDPSCSGSGIGD